MTEHFTRNTVSAAFFCSKCGKQTQHRIDVGAGSGEAEEVVCMTPYYEHAGNQLMKPFTNSGQFKQEVGQKMIATWNTSTPY